MLWIQRACVQIFAYSEQRCFGAERRKQPLSFPPFTVAPRTKSPDLANRQILQQRVLSLAVCQTPNSKLTDFLSHSAALHQQEPLRTYSGVPLLRLLLNGTNSRNPSGVYMRQKQLVESHTMAILHICMPNVVVAILLNSANANAYRRKHLTMLMSIDGAKNQVLNRSENPDAYV